MDHIENHLRLLNRAIRAGDRVAASTLAGDIADIFSALNSEQNDTLHVTAGVRFQALASPQNGVSEVVL